MLNSAYRKASGLLGASRVLREKLIAEPAVYEELVQQTAAMQQGPLRTGTIRPGRSTCSTMRCSARYMRQRRQRVVVRVASPPWGVNTVDAPSTVSAPGLAQIVVGSIDDFNQRYQKGELLGQGTYASVYCAVDRSTGQQYAVKVQQRRRMRRDRTDQIFKEVVNWRMLDGCRHVARLIQVFEDEESVLMVQELCAGGDLADHLDHRGAEPLDEEEAAHVLRAMLQFLEDAHALGVCYGDIKPSNFALRRLYPSVMHLVDPAAFPRGVPAVAVVDFGCCQRFEEGTCLPDTSITGTPLYMAPEIMKGCHGKEVDIWAAGVMLYQLLSDRFPFWAEDVHSMARLGASAIHSGIIGGAIRFDAAPWTGISDEAKDLISRMLERDVSRRITASEALRHPWFVRALGTAAIPSSP